jgi:hypothetical protein
MHYYIKFKHECVESYEEENTSHEVSNPRLLINRRQSWEIFITLYLIIKKVIFKHRKDYFLPSGKP